MTCYTTPIHIRFSDIDMNRHVNNAVYFTYMENARVELFKDEFLGFLDQGIGVIVAEASCKYRRPIQLHDQVECELRVELTGAFQFTITYRFTNAETDTLYAEGMTRMVMIDARTNRPVRIPESFIQKM